MVVICGMLRGEIHMDLVHMDGWENLVVAVGSSKLVRGKMLLTLVTVAWSGYGESLGS